MHQNISHTQNPCLLSWTDVGLSDLSNAELCWWFLLINIHEVAMTNSCVRTWSQVWIDYIHMNNQKSDANTQLKRCNYGYKLSSISQEKSTCIEVTFHGNNLHQAIIENLRKFAFFIQLWCCKNTARQSVLQSLCLIIHLCPTELQASRLLVLTSLPSFGNIKQSVTLMAFVFGTWPEQKFQYTL